MDFSLYTLAIVAFLLFITAVFTNRYFSKLDESDEEKIINLLMERPMTKKEIIEALGISEQRLQVIINSIEELGLDEDGKTVRYLRGGRG